MAHLLSSKPRDNSGSGGWVFQHAPFQTHLERFMNLSLTPLVSLIAGILILIAPRMLNYIVAIYLIIVGLVGLFGGGMHLR